MPRRSGWYHPDNGAFLDGGVAGKCLPLAPGLGDVEVQDHRRRGGHHVTATQQTNLKNKRTNYYYSVAGIGITTEGLTYSGEYVDTIRGRDWFAARLQTRILVLFTNAKKVPYTDAGIALVEAEVRAQLSEGIAQGYLAASPSPTVTVPAAASVSSPTRRTASSTTSSSPPRSPAPSTRQTCLDPSRFPENVRGVGYSRRMRQYTIYCLTDPRTEAVHYVGKTCYGERPREHGLPSHLKRWPGPKTDWIRGLHAAGLDYGVKILEGTGSNEDACAAERKWIAHGRARGWPLTNLTDGGDGVPGRQVPLEQRENVRAALSGRKRPTFSTEWRSKLAEASKGRKMPPETKEMLVALARGRKGRKLSPETRAKMSASHKGKKRAFSPDEIARLIAMNKARAGKPLSEDHRHKIAAAQRGRSLPPRRREWIEKHAAALRARARRPPEPKDPQEA
jgi:hypothetical protein